MIRAVLSFPCRTHKIAVYNFLCLHSPLQTPMQNATLAPPTTFFAGNWRRPSGWGHDITVNRIPCFVFLFPWVVRVLGSSKRFKCFQWFVGASSTRLGQRCVVNEEPALWCVVLLFLAIPCFLYCLLPIEVFFPFKQASFQKSFSVPYSVGPQPSKQQSLKLSIQFPVLISISLGRTTPLGTELCSFHSANSHSGNGCVQALPTDLQKMLSIRTCM